jgi:hypothetical protein
MKLQERNEHLRDLARTHGGRLTPEAVVETASEESHPLHDCFCWDDAEAAHNYRLVMARAMIRAVRIEIRTDHHVFKNVPIYTHSPAELEQSYVNLEEISRAEKREVLMVELDRITAAIGRCKKIAALVMPTLVADLEMLENSVLGTRSKVKRVKG